MIFGAIIGGFILGISLILISIPFLIWEIPQNWIYGYRCAKTLKPGNEAIWHKANNFTAKTMIVCGITEIIFSCLAIFWNSFPDVLNWILIITILLLPFIAVIIAAVYVKKL
jgi:hypothetical protein